MIEFVAGLSKYEQLFNRKVLFLNGIIRKDGELTFCLEFIDRCDLKEFGNYNVSYSNQLIVNIFV